MIEMKDFVTTIQKQTDNYVLNELTKGVLRYSVGIAVDVNEERCKDWIKQAIEIENYTTEQITNLKIKHLMKKKDKRICQLEQTIEQLRNEIEELKQIGW